MKEKEIAALKPYFDEYDYDLFKDDLNYFTKYLNNKVSVEGYNLNWNNENGLFTFILTDVKQILTELINTETDFTFSISKANVNNTYEIISSNHDCTSKFILKFDIPEKAIKEKNIKLQNQDYNNLINNNTRAIK